MNKEQQNNKSNEIRTNLEAATRDIETLIEHFSDPCYNPAQCRVMQRVLTHIHKALACIQEY